MGEFATYHDSELAELVNAGIPDSADLGPYLREISYTLPPVGLASMAPGMYAYGGVSSEVNRNLDWFDDPEKMGKTMPDFAVPVIDVLRHHINGERDKTGSWGELMYGPGDKEVHAALAMWAFLTLHVRRDLWGSLLRTGTVPELHRDDYEAKINTILEHVGKDELHEYVQVHPLLAKLGSPQLGLKIMLWDLYRARDAAWDIFIEIEASRALASGDGQDGGVWLEEFFRKNGPHKLPRPEAEIALAQEQDTARRVKRILAADFLAQKVTRQHVGVWHNGFAT